MFSKINIKDYNNRLEKILENKNFQEQEKNLLLSMFYKIESAYKDYSTVKVEVDSKDDFIENLLRIIKEECNDIKAVTPMTEESRELEENATTYKVNLEKGNILVYANEKDLLYALCKLDRLTICCRDEMKKEDYEEGLCSALDNLLNIGNSINTSEVIRDFNGWSWDITVKEIESIPYNLIYQNMLLLFGNTFLKEIEKEETEQIRQANIAKKYGNEEEEKATKRDYHYLAEKFQKVYLKERIAEYTRLIYQLAIVLECENNKRLKQFILQTKEELKDTLDLMEHKEKFLEEMTKKKKEINNKIGEIDTILNDSELMKKEYNARNEKLPNKEKIFSISHLADDMEKERRELLEQMKECNQMIEPKQYLKRKEVLLEQFAFLQELNIKEEGTKCDILLEKLQKEFLKCYQVQIEHAESKKEIVNLIYKLRYYLLLPFSGEKCIKDIPCLQREIKLTIEKMVQVAEDRKAIENISANTKLAYEVLKYIFDSKMITMENMVLEVKKLQEAKVEEKEETEGKEFSKIIFHHANIKIYDVNALEQEQQAVLPNIQLLNIKTGKKIPLFI